VRHSEEGEEEDDQVMRKAKESGCIGILQG
jgi:hypothetical protein